MQTFNKISSARETNEGNGLQLSTIPYLLAKLQLQGANYKKILRLSYDVIIT